MKDTTTYKGIVISAELRKHSKHEDKLTVSFNLNGSGYENAKLLPVTADVIRHDAALKELTKWAKGIINENPPQ